MDFLILAAGRSGSTFLVNSLSHHPNVRCHHEPFNQNGWHPNLLHAKNPDEALNILDTSGLPAPLYKKLYSAIQSRIGIHRGKIIVNPFKKEDEILHKGFKITWAQANPIQSSLERWFLNKEGFKCVFLYRHDYLARFVSYQIAHTSGVWNSSYKKISPEPFKVSQIALQKFFDTEIKLEAKLLKMLINAGVEISVLSYENLVKDPLLIVNEQLSFLGCNNLAEINLTTKKVIAKPMAEIVENIDDLSIEQMNNFGHEKRSNFFVKK